MSIQQIIDEARSLNRELIKEDVAKASEALLTGGSGRLTRPDYNKMQREMNVKRNKGAVVPMSSHKPTTPGRALVPYNAGSHAVASKPKVSSALVSTKTPRAKVGGSYPNTAGHFSSSKFSGMGTRAKYKVRRGYLAASAKAKKAGASVNAGRAATAAHIASKPVSATPAALTVLGAGAIGAHMYEKHAERKMVAKRLPSAIRAGKVTNAYASTKMRNKAIGDYLAYYNSPKRKLITIDGTMKKKS